LEYFFVDFNQKSTQNVLRTQHLLPSIIIISTIIHVLKITELSGQTLAHII